MGGGGQSIFTPPKNRGGGSFSHAEGAGTTSIEVVLTREPEVLALLMGGGAQIVSTL